MLSPTRKSTDSPDTEVAVTETPAMCDAWATNGTSKRQAARPILRTLFVLLMASPSIRASGPALRERRTVRGRRRAVDVAIGHGEPNRRVEGSHTGQPLHRSVDSPDRHTTARTL